MATVYAYVVGASSNPDVLECAVPWRVSASEISFGPCKTRLREELRQRLLGPLVDRAEVQEHLFLVGFNALPAARRVRKVVWAGRIREAMSFGRAWLDLTDSRYQPLRSARATPLHLEPLEGDGCPTSYRHFGLEHAERDRWVHDILAVDSRRVATIRGDTVRLMRGISWWEGFTRDICFLLENLFFATGAGLDVDDELVSILREAQPDRDGVSDLAIFGLTRGGIPDGRRGRYLELSGSRARRLLSWLQSRARKTPWPPGQERVGSSTSRGSIRRC